MKELLNIARERIAGEINRVGFINDSENTERFLDNLAEELATQEILKGNNDIDFYYEHEEEIADLFEELLEAIEEKIMCDYMKFSQLKRDGNYICFYYEEKEEFEDLEELEDFFGIGE